MQHAMTTCDGQDIILIAAQLESGSPVVCIAVQGCQLVMPPATANSIASKLLKHINTMSKDETVAMELQGIDKELKLNAMDALRLAVMLEDLAKVEGKPLH